MLQSLPATGNPSTLQMQLLLKDIPPLDYEMSIYIDASCLACLLFPAEDVLGVACPYFVLVGVVAGVGAGARGAAGHHVEARLCQLVKSLLQKIILEIVPGRVSLRRPVRVSALVQRVSEHFFGERRLPADRDARHSPEFGVGLDVSADGVRAAVPHRDVARLSGVQRRGAHGPADRHGA